MQFSKKVSTLANLHGIDGKDVLFAMLATAGASLAESFSVIFRPATTTNAGLSSKASQYIGQRPGLRKLIDELQSEQSDDPEQPKRKAGRPRKDPAGAVTPADEGEVLDYTDKDAVLKEYAKAVGEAEKISDKLSALNGIANLQRMKQEAKVEEEKRVMFYIPLSYDRCEELRDYLARYFAEKGNESAL